MRVLAYTHIFTTICFFVGMFVDAKKDKEETHFMTLFILLVVMVGAGLGLSLGTLGLLPELSW